MSKLLVTGRKKLDGEVEVQGAKNSALPIIAASILTKGENVIHNCPSLSDVDASVNILRYLGCAATRCDKTLLVKCDDINRFDVPVELMRKTRSSIVFLGAILARTGRARISFPGGCEIGSRPIDLHLNSLREMGADIREKHGYLECCVPNGLCGTKITLSFPSVGATEDIMIAACLAKGTTTIINAAREPEICDLADYLNSCGADISGAGEGVVVIEGVSSLCGSVHTIIPDRIVAATLMSCAAVTGSKIILNGIISSHLAALIPIFKNAGCKLPCLQQRVLQTEQRFLLKIYLKTDTDTFPSLSEWVQPLRQRARLPLQRVWKFFTVRRLKLPICVEVRHLLLQDFVQRAKPKSAAWSILKEATSVLSLLLHQSGQISRKFRVIRFLTVAGRISALGR